MDPLSHAPSQCGSGSETIDFYTSVCGHKIRKSLIPRRKNREKLFAAGGKKTPKTPNSKRHQKLIFC
jgi:hypothetical protein